MGIPDWVAADSLHSTDCSRTSGPSAAPWHPSALAPVFSGFHDTPTTRRHGPVAVALVDRFDVECGGAEPLGCGFPASAEAQRPTISSAGAANIVGRRRSRHAWDRNAAVHGCPERPYLTWAASPLVRQLRAGYVVVVPQLDGINFCRTATPC